MLTGKVALITGSSKGLGSDIAYRLSSYGASVIITYNHNKENAANLCETIMNTGGKAYSHYLDVTDEGSVKSIIDFIEKELGRLDILVNNAGIGNPSRIEETDEYVWDKHIDINLKGPFLCIKNAINLLQQSGDGRIVNISSVAALTGGSFGPHYASSKAGLIGLTKSAARDLGKYGISVNIVAPGPIESEMTDSLDNSVLCEILKSTPHARFAKMSEISEMVCQLFNPKINYITGQTIVVDGGRYMI
ncbi:SDR family NAD(P)-dependent oxidoreductase [Clostridium beijerinckii]|uniref:3-oxoacyl-[acyl-carrier protein] reductase n=1 Tax=Clostridium beijerinckii TaxID=1520 RepID=A0AAE5LST9_CLOBE|nr:3-oxoacyl-ACP reductase family protein [Clostridium beijerinckii]ALB46493.1 3-oxoacyl-ACP reductase FabG [Clostridium beijerinckii NRRL B-598]NSB17159.1 3-oxoacyl-[acyl-carrier protein] reductase [Clostridium beijerinckii]OOM23184.1 3-oxoacyl-[acyl-carrier-protein] reductase FabG [Clostridium beijerinckii]